MKSKTAIIGGSGFIGSHLISDLDIDSVVNLDKNPSPFFDEISKSLDVLDQKSLDKYLNNIDTVILLAAEHRDDVSPSSLYYEVNVLGTENVLKSMDKNGVKKIIFTSSVAVYGLNKNNPCEDHETDPFNHYGKSKLQAEEVIKTWYQSHSKDKCVTIIRPTVVFGERNRGNVYNLLKQITAKKFVMVGKGRNKKSMAYVHNLVGFLKNRLHSEETGFHVFNYVDKPDFDMRKLVSVVQRKLKISPNKLIIPYWIGILIGFCFDILSFALRRKFKISSVRVNKFCATTQFNASKLNDIYRPPYTLEEGLYRTLDYEFCNPKNDHITFDTE